MHHQEDLVKTINLQFWGWISDVKFRSGIEKNDEKILKATRDEVKAPQKG